MESKTKRVKLSVQKDKESNRPNWFLAIQIDDPGIIEEMTKIQQDMIELEPRLKPALVSVNKAHMTLFVFNVENTERVESLVGEWICDYTTAHLKLEDLTIKAKNVGHFDHRVIFVNLELDPALHAFCQNIGRLLLEDKIIDDANLIKFKPHLTLFKLSQVKHWQNKKVKPLRKIPEELYKSWTNHSFGTQKVSEIQLLSMTLPKDLNGYYFCQCRFELEERLLPAKTKKVTKSKSNFMLLGTIGATAIMAMAFLIHNKIRK